MRKLKKMKRQFILKTDPVEVYKWEGNLECLLSKDSFFPILQIEYGLMGYAVFLVQECVISRLHVGDYIVKLSPGHYSVINEATLKQRYEEVKDE